MSERIQAGEARDAAGCCGGGGVGDSCGAGASCASDPSPVELAGRSGGAGVENTGVIDRIGVESGTVVLGMVEYRPWSGEDLQLYQLQEKFNAYLSFALDGEMAEAYPDLEGRPLKLVLECGAEPDPRTRHLLGLIHRQISYQGIRLEVRVGAVAAPEEPARTLGGGGCGTGCGCG